jgi:hypothetical protein
VDLARFAQIFHWDHGYKYILCAVDAFSRKGFVVPLKHKSDAYHGIDSILQMTKSILMQSDNGTEFISKEFQKVLNKHNVRHTAVKV